MKCAKCGSDVPSGKRFCADCGSEIKLAENELGNAEAAGRRQGTGGRRQLMNVAILVASFIVFIAIIWVAMGSSFSSSSETVVIRIQSDTSWSGSIGTLESSRSIDGSGSGEYQLSGDVFSAVIQKDTESGYLTVSIIADGVVKVTDTTTAQYGVVSVSWADY